MCARVRERATQRSDICQIQGLRHLLIYMRVTCDGYEWNPNIQNSFWSWEEREREREMGNEGEEQETPLMRRSSDPVETFKRTGKFFLQ